MLRILNENKMEEKSLRKDIISARNQGYDIIEDTPEFSTLKEAPQINDVISTLVKCLSRSFFINL